MNNHTSKMNNSNNFKQPEALHLADYLEFSHRHAEHSPEFIAAGELRRLYAEVDRLSYQLAYPDNFVKEPMAIDWGAVHEKLCEVWQREISADEGLDEIQDLVVAATPPAQQEPVAWVCEGSSSDEKHAIDYWPGDIEDIPIGTKLYTSPPTLSLAQRKPLTDEQIGNIAALFYPRWQGHEGFARAIEAALGIKEKHE